MESALARRLWLVIILLIGLYFRMGVGLYWDEDQHLHPDERFLTMVTDKLVIPSTLSEFFDSERSTMSPYNTGHKFFVYGTLPIFITKYLGHIFGADNYYSVHIVGRVLVTIFDMLTLLGVYVLGKLVLGVRVGLIGAALFALVPQNIQLSHFFGVENYGACFVLLAFVMAVGALYPRKGSAPSRPVATWLVWAGGTIPFAILLLSLLTGLPWYSVVQLVVIGGAIASALIFHSSCGFLCRCSILGLLLGFALASKISTAFALPFVALPMLVVLVKSVGGSIAQTLLGGEEAASSKQTPPVVQVIGGGILALSIMLITFRVFQPYAFGGTSFFSFTLSANFLRNMEEVRGLMTGADIPPGVFWVNRKPFFFHWDNMLWWQMGILWFIACWGGLLLLSARMLVSPSASVFSWLLWAIFWFSYNAVQFVKAGRYLSLAYPFFALTAGYTVVWLSTHLRERLLVGGFGRLYARILSALPAVAIMGYSFLFAIAITNVYRRPHTRIEASRWIYDNIPCGSALANEHWDDGLPLRVGGKDGFGGCYKGIEFQHYHADNAQKLRHTLDGIKATDYIVISSNRLTSSIPRLPRRFPFTNEYYRMLFSGELGFTLEKVFTSYPSLGPFVLVDDDLEEMLLNYDHPKVLIFKKSSNFNPEYIEQKLKGFPDAVPVTLLNP